MTQAISRRTFVKVSGGLAALAWPYLMVRRGPIGSLDRPRLGCIGTGDRWKGVGPAAMQFADCVAVCDVDSRHLEEAARITEQRQGKVPDMYEDYRELLDRDDIDVVVIVTPDHWHTKICIDAMRAGKDVYCEKPLTLTIDEGKQLCEVVKQTGRVLQVGTQQRTEMDQRFLQAVAIVRDGRIGDVQRIHVAIGGAPTSPRLPVTEVPHGLNWDLWLGQAPSAEYRQLDRYTRCHYEFRWWYEYSGGKMTDWGAHHVDIALWAIDQLGEGQGPTLIEPISATHPVELDEEGQPTRDDQYNTATEFHVRAKLAGDIELNIRHDCQDLGFDNGIMFEGTRGRFLVNRGRIVGRPIEELRDNPLPEDTLARLLNGREPGQPNAHMRDFFDSVKDRNQPVSDAFTHHRAMTVCHLANIAIRLNRPVRWNPQTEQIEGDEQAQSMQARHQRPPFQIS